MSLDLDSGYLAGPISSEAFTHVLGLGSSIA